MSVLALFAAKGGAPKYQSKHRLAGGEDARSWPDEGRRTPRHAAPAAKAGRTAVPAHAKSATASE